MLSVIQNAIKKVEQLLQNTVNSENKLLNEICLYSLAGGKRIRPILLLLAFKSVGGKNFKKVIPIGAAYELIHTATLVHDDINDGNHLRRGKLTANKKYGNDKALIAADFLFAKGFELSSLYRKKIIDITSNACLKLAEGEFFQIQNMKNLQIKEENYFDIIKRKTALPISAGTAVGAILGKGNEKEINALSSFGMNFGIAFQIIDDILDLKGKFKAKANDIKQGKMSLPIIYSLKNKKLQKIILKEKKTKEDVKNAFEIIEKENAIQYCHKIAEKYTEKAKSCLKEVKNSKYKDELLNIADEYLERVY